MPTKWSISDPSRSKIHRSVWTISGLALQDQKQTLLKWCLGAMAVLGDRNSVMVTVNLSENAMRGLRWMENWQTFSAALLSCCLFPSQGFFC